MIPTLCFRGILELAEIEVVMSLDRSLKSASSLSRHRNVLTRAERLEVLKDAEKWDESKPVYGLPKVAHRKLAVGKAVKEESTEEAGATPAAGAKGAAPAAAKGAAAPAGAKGAAPAAKAAAPAAKKGK
jgi:small basic protein (TIGR04137 family)